MAQLDAIPDGLVELLLVSLLPSGRKAAPTTHWLAQAVVRRGADALTRPVAAWLNGCLSLSPTEGIVTPENEKKKKRRRRSDDSSSSSEEDEETPSSASARTRWLSPTRPARTPTLWCSRCTSRSRACYTQVYAAESLGEAISGRRPDARSDAHLTRKIVRLAEGGLRVELPGHLPGVVETLPRQV